VLRGLDAVLARRCASRSTGFTASELARAKQNLLRSYERTYADATSDNRPRSWESSSQLLNEEAIPGIEYEYPLAQRLVPA
jgi:hypothetical protein